MANSDVTLALLLSAQVRAVRIAEDITGARYSGLQAAARHHRRDLPQRLCNQMARLDIASAFARRISESRVQLLSDDLQSAFGKIAARARVDAAGGIPDDNRRWCCVGEVLRHAATQTNVLSEAMAPSSFHSAIAMNSDVGFRVSRVSTTASGPTASPTSGSWSRTRPAALGTIPGTRTGHTHTQRHWRQRRRRP